MANITVVRVASGRKIIDTTFDPDNIPSSDQKAALDNAVGGGLSSSNPIASQNYVDSLFEQWDWQESVQHSIDYTKAGAPTGTAAASGEKCLNTTGNLLHTFTSSWDAGVAVSNGDRFIWKDTGTDTSGDSGTHTADDAIRQYDGTTYNISTPDKATRVNVEDESPPDGTEYAYNGTAWGAVPMASETFPLADRDKVPVRMRFAFFGGFASGQTDVEVFDAEGVRQQVPMPSAGSIVKMVLYSDNARSAGTLTAEPTIEGTKSANNDLDLLLDATTTNDDRAEVAPGQTNLTFTAGQKIGVMLTSDGSWANSNGDIIVDIYVVYDT